MYILVTITNTSTVVFVFLNRLHKGKWFCFVVVKIVVMKYVLLICIYLLLVYKNNQGS